MEHPEEAHRVLLSSEAAQLLRVPTRRVEGWAQRAGMSVMVVAGVRLWCYSDVAKVAAMIGRVPPTLLEFEGQLDRRAELARRA